MSARQDVYQSITDRIISAIEAGAGKFEMPWHRARGSNLHQPLNVCSGKCYRGVNILMLWMTAEEKGYSSPTWGTYKQWQSAGYQVRQGEKSSQIVIFKEWETAPDPQRTDDNGKRIFASTANVFNLAQVEGAEQPAPLPDLGPIARHARANQFIAASGAIVHHGGTRAFYSPSSDHIQLPDDGLFIGDDRRRTESYYSTALHELTHWTGAKKRLDRDFGNRFGSKAYAFEELIAELGAAFLCATLTISPEPRLDHAQYIARWLEIMKGDKRAIVTAASAASKAADYLTAFETAAPHSIAA